MIDFLSALTFWHWLIFGLGLMALEAFLPGAFFLWPGLAAIVVGLALMGVPTLGWTAQITVWAVLSVILVTGWVLYRKKHPKAEIPNTLNQRGHEYIGQHFTLDKPVVNGKGEIRAGDTVWKTVSAIDYPIGTVVKVTGVEGTLLRIHAV
ncbi:MAG: NfeD family protein [Micavibrio aeruginosavorus]|nr:NfeD family protein [Micavibrio aeruginosavorus]